MPKNRNFVLLFLAIKSDHIFFLVLENKFFTKGFQNMWDFKHYLYTFRIFVHFQRLLCTHDSSQVNSSMSFCKVTYLIFCLKQYILMPDLTTTCLLFVLISSSDSNFKNNSIHFLYVPTLMTIGANALKLFLKTGAIIVP